MKLTGTYEGYKVDYDTLGMGSFEIYDQNNQDMLLVSCRYEEEAEKYIERRIKRLEKGEIKKRIKRNVITVDSGGIIREFTSTGASTGSAYSDDIWVVNKQEKRKHGIGKRKIYIDNRANRTRATKIKTIYKKKYDLEKEIDNLLSKMDKPNFEAE